MGNDQVFSYQYSAPQNQEVENIRKKYMPREVSKMERLRALERRVGSAGRLSGLCVGVVGCLIFGIGICFGLDVFDGADWLTVSFGAAGACMMLSAYPLFRHIQKKTRKALVPEILKLSEELIKNG